MRVISLGWGIQSWALAAMSALGKLPPVDAAIHADTTYERAETYEFAARWTPWLEERGVPVVTVNGGRPIRVHLLRSVCGCHEPPHRLSSQAAHFPVEDIPNHCILHPKPQNSDRVQRVWQVIRGSRRAQMSLENPKRIGRRSDLARKASIPRRKCGQM